MSAAAMDDTRWLMRYVFVSILMAFFGRALPLPFLPIVIVQDFGESQSVVGYVLAVYPLASLIATPWASRMARKTERIVRLHSASILIMSASALLLSTCIWIKEFAGKDVAIICLVLFRAGHGVAAALFMAVNTILVTRSFGDNVPYIVGMCEVFVGCGGQLGRLIGGIMYDRGGFACPFLLVAVVQAVSAVVGLLSFSNHVTKEAINGTEKHETDKKVAEENIGLDGDDEHPDPPLSEMLRPRTCVALVAVLLTYMLSGFADATLPKHLESHLGHISVSMISILLSVRTLTYLFVSYFCANLMHKNVLSYEHMIAIGAGCCTVGLVLMCPQSIVEHFESWLTGGHVPSTWVWTVQVVSMAGTSFGLAFLFVPSLPLMQREVRDLGDAAVEQTTALFMTCLSTGEAAGPIVGSWLDDVIGFRLASLIFAVTSLPEIFASLIWYDHKARRAQWEQQSTLAKPLLASPGRDAVAPLPAPIDIDSALVWRQAGLYLDSQGRLPSSLPSTAMRRVYNSPVGRAITSRGWATAPSKSWRRQYDPNNRADLQDNGSSSQSINRSQQVPRWQPPKPRR